MRRLGVSYSTAWILKQKLMQVMLERETRTTLTDRVEIDDAYISGERTGGKVGRGAPGKSAFRRCCTNQLARITTMHGTSGDQWFHQ